MNMNDVKMVEALMQRIEAAAKAAAVPYPMTWVKLDRYVELSGDTVDAVQARRKAGKWLDGNQCKMVDGRLWINLPAVEEWITKWEQTSPVHAVLSSARAPKVNRSV